MGITAIYSPDLGRNLDTVKPLSEQTNVPITIIQNMSMFTVDEIADEILSKHAGNDLTKNPGDNPAAILPDSINFFCR